ncbi:MAG: ABC transporter permease [Bacteroidales bacterium]|nr:ABC transporter permease [Bacteroidales bacterium]
METGFKAVLTRELKRMQSETIYIWMLLVLPIFSFVFFTAMFEEGKADSFPVAIYDADNSPLSRKVASWVEATPEVHFTKKITSLEEGKRLIEKGELYGVLMLPKGLENGVYSGNPKKIVLFYSNLNLSAGSGISVSILTTIKTMSAGINMQKRISHKETLEQAFQNIQPIRLDKHALYNPFINYAYYLATALFPTMLLMFILGTTIYIVGSELKYRTAEEWYATADKSVLVAVSAKLLPYTIIFLIEVIFMNALIFYQLGAPQNGNFFVLLFSEGLFVIAYQAMGVFLISVLPNMRLALSLGAAYASLAFSFAGLTFPIIAMHPSMQGFAHIFPLTHYMNIYINEAMKGIEVIYSLPSFAWLIVFIILPFLLIPRLRAFMTKDKYWGAS